MIQTGLFIRKTSLIAGIVANMLGFDENMTATELQNVALWVFAAFVPVMLYANFAAWKLSREPLSNGS